MSRGTSVYAHKVPVVSSRERSVHLLFCILHSARSVLSKHMASPRAGTSRFVINKRTIKSSTSARLLPARWSPRLMTSARVRSPVRTDACTIGQRVQSPHDLIFCKRYTVPLPASCVTIKRAIEVGECAAAKQWYACTWNEKSWNRRLFAPQDFQALGAWTTEPLSFHAGKSPGEPVSIVREKI